MFKDGLTERSKVFLCRFRRVREQAGGLLIYADDIAAESFKQECAFGAACAIDAV